MSEVSFYTWQGKDTQGSVTEQFSTGNGSGLAVVGQLPIKKGDVVSVNHGANRQVYTRSGRAYELEFKFGRMTRFGDGATVELDETNAKHLQYTIAPKTEFDEQVKKQKERTEGLVKELVSQYEVKFIADLDKKNIYERQQKIRNKLKVSEAVEKINDFFTKKI